MDKILRFTFIDFGPLIVFYGFKACFGLQAAILGCLFYSVLLISFRFFKKLEVSPFLIFATTVSILFGVLDLFSGSVFFSKFEPAVTNIFFGIFFGLSLLGGRKPIIQDFAERQGRIYVKKVDADLNFYFRFLTSAWVGYFFLKSLIYAVLGYWYTLEQGMALRAIFGSVSFYLLLFISIFFGKKIFQMLSFFKLLPSKKVNF